MNPTIEIDSDFKKILIIGANGFLGTNLLMLYNQEELLRQSIHFIASDLINTNIEQDIPFFPIDITNPKNTIKTIVKLSPDILILTAAMTNVDQCELDKELASKINTKGLINVIKACEKTESKLIFLSTDFIFDGTKEVGYYNEKDIPNPLNHYANTKYQAELAIMNSKVNYLICRTAVLYGWNKHKLNFITWILSQLEQKQKISIVTSQINSPTFVRNLAYIILKLIEKGCEGIFHTAGDCILNRYEIALKCAEIFNYDKNMIKPIKDFKQRAIRPKNAGLDISKLKKILNSELKIYNLDDGLNYMKEHRSY